MSKQEMVRLIQTLSNRWKDMFKSELKVHSVSFKIQPEIK